MKKFLLFLFLPALLTISANLNAQLTGACDVSDIVLTVTNPGTTVGSSCQNFTFNVSFTLAQNSGNKFIYIQSYLAQSYPNYFHCVNGVSTDKGSIKAPTRADIFTNGGPLLNLAIDNNGATPSFLSSYTPDPSIPLTPAATVTKVTLPDGSQRFTITGITLAPVPVPCGSPVVTLTDVFSSQAANGNVIHCVSCGNAFSIGVLNITGLFNCATHQLNLTLANALPTPLTNVSYTVYADINGNGILDIGTDPVATAASPIAVGTIPGMSSVNSTATISNAYLNYDYIVLATFQNSAFPGTTITNVPKLILNPGCIVTPVSFKSFNANRNKGSVDLTWTSATEQNNTGFNIQRNTKGIWENVGFVATKAVNGNSSTDLSYTYSDVNDNKVVSQYRLRQVDQDGKYKFSETRSVKGLEQSGKILLFPNPSNGGQITVVFEDASAVRDVWVSDMSGRTIKEYKAITNSDMHIDALKAGVYTVRIYNRTTGAQDNEKVVVTQ